MKGGPEKTFKGRFIVSHLCLKELNFFPFDALRQLCLRRIFQNLSYKRLAYTLTAYCFDATGCFVKALPMGRNKYSVRKIVHKTTRTDINSRTLQAAVSQQETKHTVFEIHTFTLYFEFHMHAIS